MVTVQFAFEGEEIMLRLAWEGDDGRPSHAIITTDRLVIKNQNHRFPVENTIGIISGSASWILKGQIAPSGTTLKQSGRWGPGAAPPSSLIVIIMIHNLILAVLRRIGGERRYRINPRIGRKWDQLRE